MSRIVAVACGVLVLVVAAIVALRFGTNQADSPELRSTQKEYPVPAASVTLAHDASTQTAPVSAESQARPELATTETSRASLIVDVRNARTRIPLAGVDVVAFRFDRRFPTSSGRTGEPRAVLDQTATTTVDGVVELDVEANVDLVLHVRHADTPRLLRDIVPLAPNERRETTILLDMPKRLRFFGRVVDAATGDVPEGASVEIEEFDVDARHFAATLIPHSIDSDSEAAKIAVATDGRFAIHVETFDLCAAVVRAPGFTTQLFARFEGSDTREREWTVRLDREAALAVQVIDSTGEPLDDVLVHASVRSPVVGLARNFLTSHPELGPTWEASTGTSGTATFTSLPAYVDVRVAVRTHPLAKARAFGRSLVLQPGREHIVKFDLGQRGSVRGRVVDERGNPIGADVVVRATVADNDERFELVAADTISGFWPQVRRSAETTTESDGAFRIDDLAPGKWWVSSDGKQGERNEGSAPTLVEIANGAERELVLVAGRSAYVRGRALDKNGNPVSVPVELELDGPHWRRATRSDSDGHFDFHSLPVADFRLRVGDAKETTVRSPVKGLTIECEQTRPLVVRIFEAEGAPVEVNDWSGDCVRINGQRSDSFPGRGAYDSPRSLAEVTPGTHGIAVMLADGRCGVATVSTTAGTDARLDATIELHRGGRIALFNRDANERVRADVSVRGVVLLSGSIAPGARVQVIAPAGEVDVRWTGAGVERSERIELAKHEFAALEWRSQR